MAAECRAGEACREDGSCGGCTTAWECSGGLCTAGVCRTCRSPDDDALCAEQYADVECTTDLPICGENFRCRGCQSHQECLDKAGDTDGQVCELITGVCRAGDCYPPADAFAQRTVSRDIFYWTRTGDCGPCFPGAPVFLVKFDSPLDSANTAATDDPSEVHGFVCVKSE